MKYLLVALTLFVSACSIKNYDINSTKLLTLKTSKLRFSDIAYLRYSGDAIELELYTAGQVVDTFRIDHLVCVGSKGCLTKSQFNTQYLVGSYPSDLLQHILVAKAIYGGKNLQKTEDGFIQYINTQEVAIVYKVTPKSVYFKDKKNHILIKIKDINYGK
jgi:hypothetical protein